MLVQVGDGGDGGSVCGGVGGGSYCSRSVAVLAQLLVRVATPLSFQLAQLAVIDVRELSNGNVRAMPWDSRDYCSRILHVSRYRLGSSMPLSRGNQKSGQRVPG